MAKDDDLTPLLMLGAVVLAYYLWQNSQGQNVLGTRTMSAIEDFKAKIKPVADAVESEAGLSSRLGIVQASLESKYGNSDLARPSAQLAIMQNGRQIATGPALNLFGFKCGDAWIKNGGKYVLLPTTDYYAIGQKMPNGEIATQNNQALKWPAAFRAYGSWEESYRDWARLMQTSRYQADGATEALHNDDLDAFGKALSKRYAPNQNYDQRLASRAQEMGMVA